MAHNIEVLTDALCIVGEGPLWDSKNNRLLMVDIQGKRLRSIDFKSGNITETVLNQQTGFLFLGESGELYGGAEDGIYQLLDGGKGIMVSKPVSLKGDRFNDGKVGPDGLLYGGTFSRDYSAAFYKMDSEGALTELFDGVGNSNGLDWDVKRGVMYYNDTPTGRTDCFDFEDGALYNRRPVIRYEGGNPDGMTIDSNGNLWTAVWGSSSVVCVDPVAGKVIDKIDLPVSQPSCCAFAGDDLKTLVITSAAHNIILRDEPLAGAVFAVRLDVSGVETNKICMKRGNL